MGVPMGRGNYDLGTYADDAAATAAIPAVWGTLAAGCFYVQTVSGNVRTWNGSAWTGDMQDDATATPVFAAGTVFDPAAWTTQATGGDGRNYKAVTAYIDISDADGASSLQGELLWSDALLGTYGTQPAEGSPAAGVVVANDWRVDFDLAGKAAPFRLTWPAIPMGGAFFKFQIRSGTLATNPVGAVSYMRKGV